ncbi:hypothetical protein [Embleya scabrispora]|uniref:hypothetical protein n=1 Tax=Embleya scabrispora TaxID=159449 RepID=UPI000475BEB3|nr:hypothetical protein [Embleya scabrispora]MYS79484.1 hypothetical protein [Streptomyces sp. SID5474]
MDALAFPVLAGTMLSEAVRFLFDRANAVLDRRAGRVPIDEPERLAGQAEALQVRPTELTDGRVERITQAQGALRVYMSRPGLLHSDDEELRDLLGRLRRDLEEVYGCTLPVGEEERPQPSATVSQHSNTNSGKQIAVLAQRITGTGQARVVQSTNTNEAGAELIGVQIEGSIG